MAKIEPLVVEIPLDKKAISDGGGNPFKYISGVLEQIYKDNNLPKSRRINDVRHYRTLESKGKKGNWDTAVYEIRYEHRAKVGNTIEPIKTPKDNGLGI